MTHQTVIPSGKLYNLHFHEPHIVHTGPFVTNRTRPKIVWHTTESPMGKGVGPMEHVLREKKAEPHFILDPSTRYVRQLVALNEYARSLEHPDHADETNRAQAVQVEITGEAATAEGWNGHELDSIAMLALLIEHRMPRIMRHAPPFRAAPARMSGSQFLVFNGHCGHQHVPSQPSGHWDPGKLDMPSVFFRMHRLGDDAG